VYVGQCCIVRFFLVYFFFFFFEEKQKFFELPISIELAYVLLFPLSLSLLILCIVRAKWVLVFSLLIFFAQDYQKQVSRFFIYSCIGFVVGGVSR
jgi:hypothetical protein